MEINFKNSTITLYDDYLIYKKLNHNIYETTSAIKIKKDDIRNFTSGATTFTTTSRGGSVGISVKIAKGVYMRNSVPYQNKTTYTKYSPKMILKTGEIYYLGDTFEFESNFNSINTNIVKCNKWIESQNLNTLYESLEKSEKETNYIAGIAIGWTVCLFLSFFTANIWFILFIFMLPCFYFLFETIKTFIKSKNWTALIITGIVIFLISCNFIL